jgi:hypothetical protein
VNTPRRNLLFQFMVSVRPFPFRDFENGSDCTLLLARPRCECNRLWVLKKGLVESRVGGSEYRSEEEFLRGFED